MALATLQNIRTKVRRLTRNPSPAQLSDSDIDDYVNTYILYDFPEHLRLFSLRRTLTFYSAPNIDTYSTVNVPATDPLYNFKNIYTTIHDPIYIGGYLSFFSQSREQFYSIYPIVNSISNFAMGDGVTTTFTGFAPGFPILQNNVTISAIDIKGNPLTYIDAAQFGPVTGELVVPNDFTFPSPYGSINYLTGQFTVNFPLATPPAAGTQIAIECVPYVAAIPQAMCYFNDSFILRPVPDKAYPINMEVYMRPVPLIASTDVPDLEQWWQLFAYGAAKKVFEDRQDLESVQLIMPEFKTQEALALRKTIVQQTNERTATIYTEQNSGGYGGYGGWGAGGMY
jgi:hypothetical protein